MKKYLLALSCKSIILIIISLIFGLLCDLAFGKGGILIFILGFTASLTPLIIDNEGVRYLLRYRCLEYDKIVEDLNKEIEKFPQEAVEKFKAGLETGKDELAMNFIELSGKMSRANIHGVEIKYCPNCRSFHISDVNMGIRILYCEGCRN